MTQPQGFVHPDFSHHVCKFNTFLYDLKQAPRAWLHKFSIFFSLWAPLVAVRTLPCSSYVSLMIYLFSFYIWMRLFLRVALLLFCITSFIYYLSIQFPMKDLGDLYYFLGYRLCELHTCFFSYSLVCP